MPVIEFEIEIDAPVERVFDLARSISLHVETMSKNNEKAIGGKTEGLINLNETVTWEATHFAVRQRLTSKITAFERPFHFRDSMVEGAFKRFDHDHFFATTLSKTTLMRELFDYDAPLGVLGKLADALFLKKYMTELLTERSLLIKKVAESDDWKRFLL